MLPVLLEFVSKNNFKRYFVFLRIQYECGKIRARITPNTDTFTQLLVIESDMVPRVEEKNGSKLTKTYFTSNYQERKVHIVLRPIHKPPSQVLLDNLSMVVFLMCSDIK